MPTVPVYNRQEQQQTLPSFRAQSTASTATFGGGLGQTISNIGEEAFKMQQQEQIAANNINVRDNLSKALDEYNVGYSNIMSLKGQNVLAKTETDPNTGQQVSTLSASQQTKKLANETREKYMAAFNNDTARTAFAQTFDSNVMGTQRQVLEHERTQSNIAALDSHKALETTLANTFLTNIVTGNIEGANASLRSSIDSNTSIGVHLGWSPEVKQMNQQETQNNIISNAVISLLKDKNIDKAEEIVNYYGDKLDEKTKLTLDAAIIPQRIKHDTDAVVTDVFSRYGVDNERDALSYLKTSYGDNPGYDHFATAVKAKFTDERMFKNQEETQYKKNIANQIYSASSLSDQLDIINNSNLEPKTKHDLIKSVTIDAKKIAAKKDPIDLFYGRYEKNGLIKNMATMDEYYQRLSNGEDIDDKDMKKYNDASIKITAYNAYKSGQSTTPQFTKQESSQHESEMWTAISQLANSGLSKDQIIAKINTIAPKYGFDPQYFIDNAEWSKTGNIEGGVK